MYFENNRTDILQNKFGILGKSAGVQAMLETIEQVAPTDISVLIAGESGSGKELVASALHKYSKRSHKPFVIVNCGAIPAGIIESELFGHKKGAFTGAQNDRKGYFQSADGGTIFLDEIGETPLETQVKLLRVLEQGEFLPVGSSKSMRVDVRIVAASNRDLEKEVASGSFRKDLYYRLKAITITVPSLRNRREDIAILARKFAADCAVRNQIIFKGFSEGAFQVMSQHRWPGNIRELKNFIESMVILEKGGVIKTDVIQRYLNAESSPTELNPLLPVKLDKNVDQAERELILQQLFMLRREIAEMKEIMTRGLANHGGQDGSMDEYSPALEVLPDEHVPDSQSDESPAILNPQMLGNLTAAQVEKELIVRSLERFNYNKRKTAQALQMAERTLYRKIKDYDIAKKN
ncbi:MAG: sigma-54-dependent Fis family transcriptional regulator [Candidatus Marinimicrobia bacterium]|nr:sigma-54-dependent Fis family transcriptional regulator [Candidatus Neomarinimicrobiota bacterium]